MANKPPAIVGDLLNDQCKNVKDTRNDLFSLMIGDHNSMGESILSDNTAAVQSCGYLRKKAMIDIMFKPSKNKTKQKNTHKNIIAWADTKLHSGKPKTKTKT